MYTYTYICICYSEKKNNHIFRKIFRHFGKIHYKSYNNYKCHHRNIINNLSIKKLLTYLLTCNKCIEKNIRDNNSSDGTEQLLK